MMADADDRDAAAQSGAYRDAMARLAGAVHVITTDGPGGRAGFTASSVCSVSDAPPTLLICVNRASSSHSVLARNGALCVNTLSADHREVASAFAGKLAWDERFGVGRWRAGATGQPVLVDALAAFECRIVDRKTVATHEVLFCEVLALADAAEASALVYANRRYHAVPPDTDSSGRVEGIRGLQRRAGQRPALRIA